MEYKKNKSNVNKDNFSFPFWKSFTLSHWIDVKKNLKKYAFLLILIFCHKGSFFFFLRFANLDDYTFKINYYSYDWPPWLLDCALAHHCETNI